MAVIVGPFYRALDENGDPIENATLRVRVAGSATLATSVFDDPGMGVGTHIENPLPADAGGWFPVIYAASGQQYDIAILDENGAVVREFLSMEALGSDTAAFERDFGTSRARIGASSGGVTSFEGGPPTGDDIGGKVRFGGWEDTQAEEIDLDGAAVNVGTTTGALTENGKKLDGIVLIEKTAFTGASTVAVPLTELPADVRGFEIEFFDMVMSSGAGGNTLNVALSYDGGGTYKSGASDYAYAVVGTSGNSGADDANTYAVVGINVRMSATMMGRIRMYLITPESGSNPTVMTGTATGYDAGLAPLVATYAAWGLGGYGRATHARFAASAGTITGFYRVKVLRGFGE